ncbi:DUF6686 family protein [Sphingobacterium lactis]|uniref:Uncharacterized protein n=1 Tax=Sphingobacterium lactis TaxID=797291 RepID=A0A1H5UHQ4_9SPHI|nr:DUF6686 family protein [Sphingobacterium lactis]SEF74552.1 hypothetical protein SAMN05421877_102302 [Sphingobacterium lactis]
MICPLANFEEVFQSESGAVYQCSRKNCYWLDFMGTTTAFSVRDFFQFKKRVDAIDLEMMLSNSARSFDFEIIMPFRTEHIFILNVEDIVRLRDLLAGAKFMIELNSEIRSCLKRSLSLTF